MPLSGRHELHFFKDVVHDVESTRNVIIACLKSEPTCKLKNRIPGSHLLVSSLPGSASRTHVESLGKPLDSTSILEALPGKIDIKRHSHSILYLHVYPWCMDSHDDAPSFLCIYPNITYMYLSQSELPRPIPRISMESDHGCTSRIYFDNAGDNVTMRLYNVTVTSQKPC